MIANHAEREHDKYQKCRDPTAKPRPTATAGKQHTDKELNYQPNFTGAEVSCPEKARKYHAEPESN